MKNGSPYHHGDLKSELVRIGLCDIEEKGAAGLSLREAAEKAGVSKNAPYRHFKNKDLYLGALASEGFRLLYTRMEAAVSGGQENNRKEAISEMGKQYMRFAVERPALYRLMSSPLVCTLPDEKTYWPRKALLFLASVLTGKADASEIQDHDKTVAAWAYIHGLTMLRIDNLYPEDLPQPDWEKLAQQAAGFFK
ncbi:MAG: TetR/AcrR family transcriptional regulator [Spirochaetia bacterium]